MAFAVLCRDGGILRFYQGVGPALLQVGRQGLAAAAIAQPGIIAISSTMTKLCMQQDLGQHCCRWAWSGGVVWQAWSGVPAA
jgi:hypothetical protein